MEQETEAPCARCGHDRNVHTHLRAGTECSLCDCAAYRARRFWRR